MSRTSTLLHDISKFIPRERLGVTDIELLSYGYDGTKRIALPDIVVRALTVGEISSVLKYANANHVPVVARGAASNLTGGALTLYGGIALDLTLMNRIHLIDTENLTASVDAGVVVSDLQKEAERNGLFYPPDPASNEFSTIGGNIAEGAGGIRGLKYGVTRDYVLGLEAVLADGSIIHTGVSTMKSVVGYDLTRLLVGSEGTLAVITRATLKLLPLPPSSGTARIIFENDRAALQAASKIVTFRLLPRALEFVDHKCLGIIREAGGVIEAEEGQSLLLVEFDGTESTVIEELERLSQLMKPICESYTSTTDKDERAELWAMRKSISPSIYKLVRWKVSEDICVPRSRLTAILDAMKVIEEQFDIRTLAYGHAGDGNLHVNFLLDSNDAETLSRVDSAVAELFKVTILQGGTISGEHGIGVTKQQYLGLEVPPLEMKLMKSIKSLLDPNDILNPGKIFPDDSHSEG